MRGSGRILAWTAQHFKNYFQIENVNNILTRLEFAL